MQKTNVEGCCCIFCVISWWNDIRFRELCSGLLFYIGYNVLHIQKIIVVVFGIIQVDNCSFGGIGVIVNVTFKFSVVNADNQTFLF